MSATSEWVPEEEQLPEAGVTSADAAGAMPASPRRLSRASASGKGPPLFKPSPAIPEEPPGQGQQRQRQQQEEEGAAGGGEATAAAEPESSAGEAEDVPEEEQLMQPAEGPE